MRAKPKAKPRTQPRRRTPKFLAPRDQLYAHWAALHSALPATLYHYSTAQGLLSMVKSGHIWATESRYMNDPREFLHGAELILQIVERRLEKKASQVLFDLREAVRLHFEEKRQNLRIFATSFCVNGDLLSQWRGYGDVGGGYALGFRPELLLGSEPEARPPLRVLRRVLYDRAEQERIIDEWLDAVDSTSKVPEGFWSAFSEAVVSFKDAAYAEEDEWRLIQFGRAWHGSRAWLHPVEFRERKGRIIPYADLDLSKSRGAYASKLPISEIVHGPTQDVERSGKALRLLAEACGYSPEQLTLRHSQIPFTT